MNLSHHQRGASIVHWLVALFVLLGFGALAIDLNNVYVAHAELQAAADAGALEGARMLYNADGTINPDVGLNNASDPAHMAAIANLSQGTAVEVVSVERGHWEFMPSPSAAITPTVGGIDRGGEFTASTATVPAPLFYLDPDGNRVFRPFTDSNVATTVDVNSDPAEINAVRVRVARQTTPVRSLLARVLGIDDFEAGATGVAYVGFAGKIAPGEMDCPIAMCEEILTQGCDLGRMVPSPDQTGGWTNFNQPEGTCGGATNADELTDLVNAGCPGGGANPVEILLGVPMQVNNGQVNSAFDALYDCWVATGSCEVDLNNPDPNCWPTTPVSWKLPVIAGCRFGGDCAPPVGAVEVTALWMVLQQNNNVSKMDGLAPLEMSDGPGGIDDWIAPAELRLAGRGVDRWNDFVTHFQITRSYDEFGNPVLATWENLGYQQQTLYFEPDCDAIELGGTGGANYGVRAAVPVLVY